MSFELQEYIRTLERENYYLKQFTTVPLQTSQPHLTPSQSAKSFVRPYPELQRPSSQVQLNTPTYSEIPLPMRLQRRSILQNSVSQQILPASQPCLLPTLHSLPQKHQPQSQPAQFPKFQQGKPPIKRCGSPGSSLNLNKVRNERNQVQIFSHDGVSKRLVQTICSDAQSRRMVYRQQLQHKRKQLQVMMTNASKYY